MTLTIPTLTLLNEQGELPPEYRPSYPISSEILLQGYRTMMITRLVDEKMLTLQRQGTITFAMSSLGEEACAVASAAALTKEDWMYPQYREAGIMFWRGCTVQQYVHHMFGNSKDWIFGRQMPNHFGSRDLNVVTVSSPIGTKIPHAAGCAYAMKLQKEQAVSICYFGEGATSEGDFHAGLNFAAVRKCPVIFFCRNNGYAISTPSSEQYASDGIAGRGAAYGMPAYRIDGNDFFAIYETIAKARDYCISTPGPVLIEAMTYRMGAHSSSDDPTLYRKEGELEYWQQKCPLLRLKRYLEKQGLWDANQEEQLIKQQTDQISEAIGIAKETSRPALKYLIEHVYHEPTQNLKEQYEQLKIFFPNE